MNILYLEDNPTDSDLLLRHFSTLSDQFTLVHVSTLKEACDLIMKTQEMEFDVVLADFQLPDGTGMDLLHQVRLKKVPVAVVLITGQGDEQTAVTALKSGADDYVPKSVDYLESLPAILKDVYKRIRGDTILRKKKLKVLYAEHLTSDIDLTRRHLSANAPYIDLDVVNNAHQMLSEIRENPRDRWDVLLMDYQLPGMNALEALREINHLGTDLPIIIVTGQGDEQVAAHALRQGAIDYIVKHPGYLYELAPALENAYHLSKLQQEHHALQASEERFRVAQEASPVGFTILHPIRNEKGKIIDFAWVYENRAIARINGTDPEVVIGKRLLDLFPTHQGSSLFEAYKHVSETGIPQVFEDLKIWEFILKPTWLHLVIVPMGDEIAIFAEDISERKRLEIERQKFFLIAESSSEFIGMCDLDMKPIYVNPAGRKLVGLPDMEAACRVNVQDYFFPEDQALIRDEFFPKVLRDGQGDVEIRLRHFQTGEPIWMYYYLFVVRDPNGKSMGWATVSRNITLRRQAEQAVREYNQRLEKEVETRTAELKSVHEQMIQQDRLANLGRLAGGMAHELRNPLGVISNAVYYLRMILPDANEKVKEYLGILEKESQAAVHIMSDLLNFSTFQAGDRHPCKVEDLINNVLRQFSPQPSIKVDVIIPEKTPDVYVDSHQVEMAFGRLMVNAYQAMEKGGVFKIIVKPPAKVRSEQVTICFEDTGMGISPENLPQIFEPLFTTKPRHIGLGLPISKRLIEVNGGTITVASQWGKGTNFTVTLPVKTAGEK